MTEVLETKNFKYKSEQRHISVKGKLKEKHEFKQNTIKANKTIFQITEKGYLLPLIEIPSEAKLSNNESFLTNSGFVQGAMADMLLLGTIKQVKTPLRVINSLSVSLNSKVKEQLILDLRLVNDHLYLKKIKFDDYKCFENYLRANKGYLFKFDLKNGYRHINIFQPHQMCLGFFWF